MNRAYLTDRQLRRKHLLYKLKVYGAIFLFLLLIWGIAYLIVYSPVFKIKEISLKNLNPEPSLENPDSENKFRERLVNDLKSLVIGNSIIRALWGSDNILIWDGGMVQDPNFIKRYPEISKIEFKKNYWQRKIEISYEKRGRFGIWCEKLNAKELDSAQIPSSTVSVPNRGDSSSDCWWFDKKGIIFSEAPIIEGDLIYSINDFSGRRLKIGDKVLNDNLFDNLVKIFDVLEKSGLKIKTLRLENVESQEIATDSANINYPKIYFSLRNDPNFSLGFLQSIENLGLGKTSYIDLRVGNRVYYK